jgi:hypothetical protein
VDSLITEKSDQIEDWISFHREKIFPPREYQLICRAASIACGHEIRQILDEGGCPEQTIYNL